MRALSFVFAAALLPASVFSQTLGMESDWLELVKGHHDTKSGVDVMDVVTDPKTGEQMVKLSIPKETIGDEVDDDMEEVKVIGRAPDKKEPVDLLPELETQWIDDYDNDHYGLLVKFKKRQAIPFRLFFSDQGQAGAIDGAVQP